MLNLCLNLNIHFKAFISPKYLVHIIKTDSIGLRGININVFETTKDMERDRMKAKSTG